MTDREKLIELLDHKVDDDWYTSEEIADYLLSNGVRLEAKQATSDENKRWIPVSERLPSWNDGKVLVFTKYGFSICERTVNGRWKGQHANWITHWMPLPEPPKEETMLETIDTILRILGCISFGIIIRLAWDRLR